MRLGFRRGLLHGIPIALGYFSVSFGFGILAVRAGLSVLETFCISLTNLTSAGQTAGVAVIAAGGSYLEMAATQLVINIRYALMSLSLSQRLDASFHLPQRLLVAFGMTDEVFAMASSQEGSIPPRYMYGMILIAAVGWDGGTLLGAVAGNILPAALTDAMGIVLYSMFLAILLPVAKKQRSVLVVILIAAGVSMLLSYGVPVLPSGYGVLLSAIVAATLAAFLFPTPEEKEDAT